MLVNWFDSSSNCTTYDLALVFLLLRLRRLTRFFLHLALILTARESADMTLDVPCEKCVETACEGGEQLAAH